MMLDSITNVLTIPEQISGKLKMSILDGKLKPGEKLPCEEDLAIIFGVSRPTIRKSLALFSADGILIKRRGCQGGYFVSDCFTKKFIYSLTQCITSRGSELEIKELQEMQTIIQLRSGALATKRRSENDLKALFTSIPLTYKNSPPYLFLDKVITFQLLVTQASHNNLLIAEMENLSKFLRLLSFTTNVSTDQRIQFVNKMYAIHDSLVVQNTVSTVVQMKKCLEYSHIIHGILSQVDRLS